MKQLALFLAFAALPAQAAIFGADDRKPVLPGTMADKLARATAVAVLSANEIPGANNTFSLDTRRLSEQFCREEKFSQDPSLSYACTGFLVAPDLLVTAGHCSVNVGESRNETTTYCKTFSWLFDYQQNAFGFTKLENIPNEKLYRCKETIYAVNDEKLPFRDFAVIRLDRPVEGREPLKMAAGGVKNEDILSMIGYPLGTPAKRSINARVLMNNPERKAFVTNLDAFQGNSGSPVFNQQNEVVGILVSGFPSANYFVEEGKTCNRYNRCDENGLNCLMPDLDLSPFPNHQTTGSDVQRIEDVIEFIKTIQ